jgi:hypothetical protein
MILFFVLHNFFYFLLNRNTYIYNAENYYDSCKILRVVLQRKYFKGSNCAECPCV